MEDTITAIATAPGEGGISIVRISGPDSLRIADDVFRGHGAKPSERPSHIILHGRIVSSSGDLDEVLLLVMRAPHSYTGEDVVEIQGHGGPVTARRILRRVMESGARTAEPGEFTRRAFVNGRMDLLQAEAVLDLVRAKTDRAAAAALEQLEGGLSKKLSALYESLLASAANLEATLDFPEDELPTATRTEIQEKVAIDREKIEKLLATWEEGHLLREGALCVITGKTNVGKSTMLNALLERGRAIVSPRHGTTRDSIEESFVLDGFLIRLVDTAGLRESDCDIEQEGIRRTKELLRKADLRIHVLDASGALNDVDRLHLDELDARHAIVVANKTDLGNEIREAAELKRFCVVNASLVSGRGLAEIRRAISEKLMSEKSGHAEPQALISERHRKSLLAAKEELESALNLLAERTEDKSDLASHHLRAALEDIGRITGRVYEEELLTAVFSRFCVGK